MNFHSPQDTNTQTTAVDPPRDTGVLLMSREARSSDRFYGRSIS